MGVLFENGLAVDKDFTTAMRNYKAAAELNYPKAYTKCGNLYYSGKGVPRVDKTEAFNYFKRGALAGDTEAMNSAGLMLESGFDAIPADHI